MIRSIHAGRKGGGGREVHWLVNGYREHLPAMEILKTGGNGRGLFQEIGVSGRYHVLRGEEFEAPEDATDEQLGDLIRGEVAYLFDAKTDQQAVDLRLAAAMRRARYLQGRFEGVRRTVYLSLASTAFHVSSVPFAGEVQLRVPPVGPIEFFAEDEKL